jgi:hypothetical protein
MRAPAVGQERAGSHQEIVGGQPQPIDQTPPVQAPTAPLPSRSRGPVLTFDYTGLSPDLADDARATAAIGAVVPNRADPSLAVGFALCARCAAAADLDDRVVAGLRCVWPDARRLVVTHPEGGRA